MARPKFDPDLCTKHFTAEQRSQLTQDAWKFLFESVEGSLAAIYFLKPVKIINDFAPDFVASDIGRSYWPLSQMYNQWQWEASLEETQAFVADLMGKERRKHTADDPSFMVDWDPKSKPSKGPKTPNRTTFSQSRLNLSSKKNSPSITSSKGKRPTPSTTTDFSQESYAPPDPNREKSPIIAPEIPYREPSVHPPPPPTPTPTSRRSIRPTEASRHIALGPNRTASLGDPNSDLDIDDDTIIIGAPPQGAPVHENITPIRSKRPAEDDDQSYQGPPTPQTPTGRPNKRAAPNRLTSPVQVNEATDIPQAVTSPTVADDELPVPPSSSTGPSGPMSDTDNEAEPSEAIFQAYGLKFTAENITKIPEVLLAYIDECEEENLRSEDAIDTEEKRVHFRYRARLFRELGNDLESRIRRLSSDPKERERMEKKSSLLASRST